MAAHVNITMKFSCCFLQIPSQYNVLSTNNDLLSKNIILLIYLLKPKPKPCMSKKSSAYLSKASQLCFPFVLRF